MRVVTMGAVPPEKAAYALARYSRSSDSIEESLEWVRNHDSTSFLDSYYFQYGHASIADLGHIPLCFEGISELAATEIQDEQLWDGQARSSRYQDFSKCGYVVPPGLEDEKYLAVYNATADLLLTCYKQVHEGMVEYLKETLPRPNGMPVPHYARTIDARAFDVARYLLFWGIPTGVGQITSIRTLEKQMARLRCTDYSELHNIATMVAGKLSQPPSVSYRGGDTEPIAPTLAKHLDGCNDHQLRVQSVIREWIENSHPEMLASGMKTNCEAGVKLMMPKCAARDIVATLLYPLCDFGYMDLYYDLSDDEVKEVIDIVYTTRERAELLRSFRTQRYVFDITMDHGAYRDLHRHRRVQHFRKPYSASRGFAVPEQVYASGLDHVYRAGIEGAEIAFSLLPPVAREYILPFATHGRFLMKMDAAEVDYITRLRTGVKGHFSYRKIAWEMAEEFKRVEPVLGKYLEVTHPDVVDELKR